MIHVEIQNWQAKMRKWRLQTPTQLAEAKTVKKANSYLKKGWKLLRCLMQRDGHGERALYVLIKNC